MKGLNDSNNLAAKRKIEFVERCLIRDCLCVQGSAGCVQAREGNRPQAGVCRPLHHGTAVGRRHQRTMGPTGHQHSVSEPPNWAAPQNSCSTLTSFLYSLYKFFPQQLLGQICQTQSKTFTSLVSFLSAVASRLVIFTKCQPRRHPPPAVSDLPPLCRWSKSTETCTAPRG